MDKNRFIMSFTVDKTFDSDRFLKLRLRVCHDGESPNKTYFTKDTMAEANKSLEYIPLLAHVYVDQETGKPAIGSHDMHIEEDKLNEGESRVIYDEAPIGVVPALADNNCTIEEYEGLNYTFVDCYLWRDYANYAEQLVENAENTKLSMEIDMPNEALSYDATNDRYNISSYRYRGITLLNESLGTGMKDALATTTNFSANDDIKSKMLVLMEELQKCLREYSNGSSEEKEGIVDMDNNEEVAEPVVEDVVVETMEETTEVVDETMTEDIPTEESVDEAVVVDEEPVTEEFSDGEIAPLVCTFRISHDDTRYGLQSLLNTMCDESHFYSVLAVYDKYFYYCDYFSGDSFKQAYKVRKDVVSFSGDPEPVFTEFVTQAERDALEKLRKDYAELVQFKADVEATQLQAQKDAIFTDNKYAHIKDSKMFQRLIDNSKDYSIEECRAKADEIWDDLSSFAVTFAAKNDNRQKSIGIVYSDESNVNEAPYGGLFDD